MQKNYDLRWKFVYHDGTADCFGFWTREANKLEEMAAFKKQTNIERAFVELKDKRTGITTTPVHCVGADFCLFKWVKIARLGFTGGKSFSELVGLTLVSRDYEATVFVDGKIAIKKRSEEDKTFHYEGFGK